MPGMDAKQAYYSPQAISITSDAGLHSVHAGAHTSIIDSARRLLKWYQRCWCACGAIMCLFKMSRHSLPLVNNAPLRPARQVQADLAPLVAKARVHEHEYVLLYGRQQRKHHGLCQNRPCYRSEASPAGLQAYVPTSASSSSMT